MNVLFGLYQPEQGEIKIKGKPVKITNPNIANDLGIEWSINTLCLFIILQLQRILFSEMNRRKRKIAVEDAAKEIQNCLNNTVWL